MLGNMTAYLLLEKISCFQTDLNLLIYGYNLKYGLKCQNKENIRTTQGFFFVFPGAKIRPHSLWTFSDFFPNCGKNPNLQKKIFFEDWDFHSVNNTHTSVLLQFNGNSMCNS